jgi:hypothetical protein
MQMKNAMFLARLVYTAPPSQVVNVLLSVSLDRIVETVFCKHHLVNSVMMVIMTMVISVLLYAGLSQLGPVAVVPLVVVVEVEVVALVS